jgi:hypothetical protein
MTPRLSVVLPTHQPHPGRLAETLEALRGQDLDPAAWELLLVDNASPSFVPPDLAGVPHARVVREQALGLTFARRHGIHEARGEVIVFVDDDNVLAAGYLREALRLLDAHPRLGAAGGRVRPRFETSPPEWVRGFDRALALRDLGDAPIIAAFVPNAPRAFPEAAPIGAGMVLRRAAAEAWLAVIDTRPSPVATDRQGSSLASGGDNDIVLTILDAGWEVGYFPSLELTHLIPAGRCTRDYLGRLLRESHRSWIGVLAAHGLCRRRPIPRWLAPAMKLRAWCQTGAWRGPAEYLHWQDRCGEIEGRTLLR